MLKLLDTKQIKRIYRERMVRDFPAKELKPLKMMLDAFKKGIYECYGMYEGDETIGYAFLLKSGDNYLVDYLAVKKNKRNGGIGSRLLSLIGEKLSSAESVFVEAEDPDFAKKDEDISIQTRRINFYLRNGYKDTGLRTELFGVNYRVLEADNGRLHDTKAAAEIYKLFYSAILENPLLKKQFSIMNEIQS